jgi:predicted small secreted protein
MNIVDKIKRNKIASLIIFIVLLGLFVAPSECNGVRGWGACVSMNGKVYHLSPLNFILPPPPGKMIVERADMNHGMSYSPESGFSIK